MSSFDPRSPSETAFDRWDQPHFGTRHDTEDMMARVGRSETETNDAWRRIEDQLRGLSRRMDSSERSHSESHRVLSRTAQDVNHSTREHNQAFDQLGLNVMAMNERLQRLERATAHDGTREAVKALHQGLSRLADQITATANNSASQVSHLTANLEQLAARVGQARVDAEDASRALEQRLNDTGFHLESRIAAAEKAAQFNASALDRTLEKLNAHDSQRATDQVESQRRHGQAEESITRLEDAISRLEMRLPDTAFDRRMDGIEHAVTGMAQRLENFDPAARFEDAMRGLAHRLDTLEKDHAERAAQAARVPEPPLAAPAFSTELPPSAFAAYDAPLAPQPPHAFGATPEADPFAPASDFSLDFNELFVQPQAEAQPDNFLSQARRSARAANEKIESTEKPKARYLTPAILAALVVVAVAASLVLMKNQPKPAVPQAPVATPRIAAAPAPVKPVVAPAPAALPEPNTGVRLTLTPPVATPHQPAAQPHVAQAAPAKPVVKAPPAMTPNERVTQLAGQGNAVALTILGLRALDGTDGQAVNLPDAIKYLTQAAQKGQAVAQYRLGTLYERGQGVTADGTQAMHWYELAANQGNRKAMHNLAVAYASGAGGKKNMAEAARWFAKAATMGLSDSQFNLAVLYERGDGVPQSLTDAFKWYSVAAATGDQESRQRIAALQTQLPDGDKATATKAAADFRITPLNRAANVPPEAGDLRP